MKRLPKYCLFIIPLIINIFFITGYDPAIISGGDSADFELIARNILEKGEFFDGIKYAFRAPLYPIFISATFAILGKFTFTIFIAQIITSALSAVLVYQISKVLSGKLSAIIAWYLMILSPYTLLFCKQVLRTNAIILWLLIFLSLFLYARINRYKKLYQSLFFGVACGLGALLAPSVIPLIIVFWILIIFDKEFSLSRRISWLIPSAFVCLIVISPWVLRSYKLFNQPVLVSSTGFNFYIGNNPGSDGTYRPASLETFSEQELRNEITIDRAFLKRSLQYCKQYPLGIIERLPEKVYFFFQSPPNPVLNLFDVGLAVAFLLCLYIAKDYPDTGYKFLLLPFLLRFLTVLVFFGAWRYRIIIYPFIYIFISVVTSKFLIKKHNIKTFKD